MKHLVLTLFFCAVIWIAGRPGTLPRADSIDAVKEKSGSPEFVGDLGTNKSVERPRPSDSQLRYAQRVATSEKAIILIYNLGKTESQMWLISSQTIEAFLIPPREQIEARVNQYLRSIMVRPSGDPEDEFLGKNLYQMIV